MAQMGLISYTVRPECHQQFIDTCVCTKRGQKSGKNASKIYFEMKQANHFHAFSLSPMPSSPKKILLKKGPLHDLFLDHPASTSR